MENADLKNWWMFQMSTNISIWITIKYENRLIGIRWYTSNLNKNKNYRYLMTISSFYGY